MIEEIETQDEAAAHHAAAERLAAPLREALDTRGEAVLMLSGGNTPKTVIPLLAAHPVDWSKVTIYASDERCVPLDHPASTQGMIEALFKVAGATPRYIAPERFDPTGAERWAERVLELAPADAGLIGIGEDGHTASLFPGDPAEQIETPGALLVHPRGSHQHDRITLTTPALARTRTLVLIAQTPQKRAALALARAENRPVGRALSASGRGVIVACAPPAG